MTSRRQNAAFMCMLAALLLSAPSHGGEFSLSALKSLLDQNPQTGRPVQSLTELIPILPEELRQNFTLVYDSRSPFRASISARFPRVILFTPDAKLVLTFTGDPNRVGYNILETMAWKDSEAVFEFGVKILPAAKVRETTIAKATMNCTSCHDLDAKPIYDSYPLWPGFYGSTQDSFPKNSWVARKELALYRKFLSGPAHSGVYENLVFPRGSPVSPYLDPRLLKSADHEVRPENFAFMPNTRLGMALTELNRQRLYRKLSQNPKFIRDQATFLQELLNCGDPPPPLGSAKIAKALVQENNLRLRRMGFRKGHENGAKDMQELKFIPEISTIMQMTEKIGTDPGDWSMAMEKNSLSFFDGILSGNWDGQSYYIKEDFIYGMLSHMGQTDERLRPYFLSTSVYEWMGYPFGHRVNIARARESCRILADISPRL